MNSRARLALEVAKTIQKDIVQWEESLGDTDHEALTGTPSTWTADSDGWTPNNEIYAALSQISDALANSYAQVIADLNDSKRSSWAGTAHEIREVTATMLRELAPGEEVMSQPWYEQEPTTKGPTQKQRVRYILQERGAGSKTVKVVEQISDIDRLIQNLVRTTYERASVAAHSFGTRDEVRRILRYFEVFAQDILGLP